MTFQKIRKRIELIPKSDEWYQSYLAYIEHLKKVELMRNFRSSKQNKIKHDLLSMRKLSSKHWMLCERLCKEWISADTELYKKEIIKITMLRKREISTKYFETDWIILNEEWNLKTVLEIKSWGKKNYEELERVLANKKKILSLFNPNISALGIYIKNNWAKDVKIKDDKLGFTDNFNELKTTKEQYNSPFTITDSHNNLEIIKEYDLWMIRSYKLFARWTDKNLLSWEDYYVHNELTNLRKKLDWYNWKNTNNQYRKKNRH